MRQKKRGEKMQVTSNMLLKTHGEKMSVFTLSIMLLKISWLQPAFHYLDEEKWVSISAKYHAPGVGCPEFEGGGGSFDAGARSSNWDRQDTQIRSL